MRRRIPSDEPTRQDGLLWIGCDITDAAALAAKVRTVAPIDIVVYVPVREQASSVLVARDVDYAAALDRCLQPCLSLIQELVPGMAARGYGRFINLFGASVLAPLWDHTLSNVARAATLALCSGAARECAESGVSFNTIVLGLTDTPGLASLWRQRTGGDPEKLREYAAQRVSQIPGKKMGDPDQCAMLCALLASPAMGYLNGQSIRLDGGLRLSL